MTGYGFNFNKPPTNDPGWRLYNNYDYDGPAWVCEATPENSEALKAVTKCGTAEYGWYHVMKSGCTGWSRDGRHGSPEVEQPVWQTENVKAIIEPLELKVAELLYLLLAARNALQDNHLETGPRGHVIARINAVLNEVDQ